MTLRLLPRDNKTLCGSTVSLPPTNQPRYFPHHLSTCDPYIRSLHFTLISPPSTVNRRVTPILQLHAAPSQCWKNWRMAFCCASLASRSSPSRKLHRACATLRYQCKTWGHYVGWTASKGAKANYCDWNRRVAFGRRQGGCGEMTGATIKFAV